MKVKETIEKLSLGLLIATGMTFSFISCSNEDDWEEMDVYTLSNKMATRAGVEGNIDVPLIKAGSNETVLELENGDVVITFHTSWGTCLPAAFNAYTFHNANFLKNSDHYKLRPITLTRPQIINNKIVINYEGTLECDFTIIYENGEPYMVDEPRSVPFSGVIEANYEITYEHYD